MSTFVIDRTGVLWYDLTGNPFEKYKDDPRGMTKVLNEKLCSFCLRLNIGTPTGTASEVLEDVARKLKLFGYAAKLEADVPDSFDLVSLKRILGLIESNAVLGVSDDKWLVVLCDQLIRFLDNFERIESTVSFPLRQRGVYVGPPDAQRMTCQ